MRLVSLIYSKHTISSLKQQSTLHGNSPLLILPPKTNPLSSLPSSRSTSPVAHQSLQGDRHDTYLEVEPDETIISKALDSGLSVPHDCKLGVCMTCPAKLISGVVDQREGMLSDDVIERGFALLCASYPRSDCTIRTIPEEEMLSLQLATAND